MARSTPTPTAGTDPAFTMDTTVDTVDATVDALALAATTPTRPVIAALLARVDDPEVGIDIISLGLVYGIDVGDTGTKVTMSVTTPACPLGAYFEDAIHGCLRQLPGIGEIAVDIVYEPAWSPEMINDHGRAMLGWPR